MIFELNVSLFHQTLLVSPVSGDSFQLDPSGFTSSTRNTDCSRIRVFHTQIGRVENSTIYTQPPRSENSNVKGNIVGGEYDVLVQSFDPLGRVQQSPRSTPVRITVVAKCANPIFSSPVNEQVYSADPAGLYAEMSNVDCPYVYSFITELDTGIIRASNLLPPPPTNSLLPDSTVFLPVATLFTPTPMMTSRLNPTDQGLGVCHRRSEMYHLVAHFSRIRGNLGSIAKRL